jgi:mycoredoxin
MFNRFGRSCGATSSGEGAGPREQVDAQAGDIIMYSTRWCGDCRRARRVFAALGVPYHEIDIEDDDAARQVVLRLNGGMASVPTIVFPDGTRLVEPGSSALEARLIAYRDASARMS